MTKRLWVLLVSTAVLYCWNITINGMGNQFYAASAQAGAKNWEALLFGSLDARNFITVDKPPLSQWVMGLSGRVFGFNSASMLIPQALMAVAAVALLYGAVARISGPRAGLLAGAVLALTPVAVLMFRFNNPDAAMVLLMTAAAYCTVRAVERGSAKWLAWAGVAVGFAFLAKMLEGVLVLPALAAAYLWAAPVRLRVRALHLLGGAAAIVVSAGWFVVLTMVWPASSRPYLAGSTDNSFMNLVLGYNGVARVLGRNHDALAATPGAFDDSDPARATISGFGGHTHSWARLFFGEYGVEVGWLVPAALLATVVVVLVRGRAPRTDLVRAGAVVFGGWLLVDGLVLSLMHGMIHPYYTLSIAPPVAAMFAIGVQQMWAHRESDWCRGALAAMLLAAGGWGWRLLASAVDSLSVLRWIVLAVTVVASLALLGTWSSRVRRGVAPAVLALALLGALGGPAAYAVTTVGVAHRGGNPTVGPSRLGHVAGDWGMGADNRDLDALLRETDTPWSAAIERSSSAAALELATDTSVMAIGGFSGTDPTPTLAQFQNDVARHRVAYYVGATGRGPGWTSHSHDDIAKWVSRTFHPMKVGNATVYDLR